jgi:site-specific recombinase XerD
VRDLLDSWLLALRAERKSPQTIKTYGDGVRRFLTWCDETDVEPRLEKPIVDRFVVDLLDAGAEPATARSRHLAVRRFSGWLADEGEISADLLRDSKPPRLDVKVTRALTDTEIKALLAACAGQEFRERRDTAIIRLMVETGMRAGEVVGLRLADVDVAARRAVVERGKGGKGRVVSFSTRCASALDRYMRTRKKRSDAASVALWLPERQGRGFTYWALHKVLVGRAEQAGIVGFHPHVLRHTAATRWLSAGGTEGGLMAVAGWTRRDMLDRYTAHTASERAAEEADRLGLGDL